jgi:hypothetical protein
METAQAAANVIFQQGLASYYGSALTHEARKEFLNQRLRLRPAATGASRVRGEFSEPLMMLLAAAGLVLLLACANLGNLLLTRATARNREFSVRLALGASRGRLVRQVLAESMTLALLGGVAGLAAAWLLRMGLLRLVSDSIHLPLRPDARIFGFVFALTLVAGFVLALLPALRAARVNAAAGLKEQGRNPLGMHITQIYANQRNTFEIVGVAGDARGRSLRGEIEHRFYVPLAQPIEVPDSVNFAIRTVAEPSSVIAGVRRAAHL